MNILYTSPLGLPLKRSVQAKSRFQGLNDQGLSDQGKFWADWYKWQRFDLDQVKTLPEDQQLQVLCVLGNVLESMTRPDQRTTSRILDELAASNPNPLFQKVLAWTRGYIERMQFSYPMTSGTADASPKRGTDETDDDWDDFGSRTHN